MKIILIRHGNKENEKEENPHLSIKGKKQAKLLAKRLKKIKIDEFYSTDMYRAKETAEIIRKEIKLKPIIHAEIEEFRADDLKKSNEKWAGNNKKKYKDLILFIKRITKNPNSKKTVLISSHGILNRIIIAYLLDVPFKKTIVFMQNETCLDILSWADKYKNWRLEVMNDDSHIPERLK